MIARGSRPIRAQAAEGSDLSGGGNSNPKRLKEDQDNAQKKLTDQNFNISMMPTSHSLGQVEDSVTAGQLSADSSHQNDIQIR